MNENIEYREDTVTPKEIIRVPEPVHRTGLATASLVLGIIGGAFFFLLFVVSALPGDTSAAAGSVVLLSFLISILALIFGLVSIRKSPKKGFSITGISIGGSVIVLMALLLIIGMVSE
ncbi:hypothetical protein [Cohnella endophytica]|uniref:hypothetical protein n=1 Tax=Cohnella endophytica TaxID=2419778 RepID=UPI0011C45CF4|nr:hypothetical protein [Cohnella endophytica]